MKKGVMFSLLVFAVFVFGFVSLVSAGSISNVANFGRNSPFMGYSKVSNDLVVVYGASSYQLGDFSGTPYYYLVNVSSGDKKELNVPQLKGNFPSPIVTKDYLVLTDTLNKKDLFYRTQNGKLEFSIDYSTFADEGAKGNCSSFSENGAYVNTSEVLQGGPTIVQSDGNSVYYLLHYSCVGYMHESNSPVQLGWGSIYLDSINLNTLNKERIGALLYGSNPKILSIDGNEMYLETFSRNGFVSQGSLFRYNLSSSESTLLLSNISGSNILKDGNIILWMNETPITKGTVNAGVLLGEKLNGFSYYNISDGSVHSLDFKVPSNPDSIIGWDFSSGKLVWDEVPGITLGSLLLVNNKLKIYDFNSGKMESISPNLGLKTWPLIMGNKLVWINYGANFVDWFFNGKYVDATIQSTKLSNI